MGFRTGAYASVFGIEKGKGNFTKGRLSISRKNKMTGEYEQEFSGYVMFIGSCATDALSLADKDRIRLGDVDVSNVYDKNAKREYTNFKVFSYEKVQSQFPEQSTERPSRPQPAVEANSVEANMTESDDEELPF